VLFVIIGRDSPQAKDLRPKLRPAHLAHLADVGRRARIVLAGPLTDGAGSLIVLDARDERQVRAIAESDPYFTGGVFAEVEVHPFTQVLPEI
jgi:hypothetical protein